MLKYLVKFFNIIKCKLKFSNCQKNTMIICHNCTQTDCNGCVDI